MYDVRGKVNKCIRCARKGPKHVRCARKGPANIQCESRNLGPPLKSEDALFISLFRGFLAVLWKIRNYFYSTDHLPLLPILKRGRRRNEYWV